jgi:uroporphyrinogen III methyltransferase/synthase
MKNSDQVGPSQHTPEQKPLLGRTILITRTPAQSAEITSQLEARGASVIHCPTIEVVPPSSWAPLDAAIETIGDYDWIVFTSANAVSFFFSRLGEKRSDGLTAIAGRLICAIGPATARTLAAVGAVTQLVASDSKSEGALSAIIDHVGGEERVRGMRFLIPRAKIAREVLPAGLRKLGAHVDAIETYQTIRPDVDANSIVRLFELNSIDAITFTSSSTVSNFAALVGSKDLSDLLGNTLAACIGPVTAETASEHGLKRIITPQVYSAAALVEAIVESLGAG